VIERLESRAMLAGVGPESWSAPGLAPAPLGTGALFSSGIVLTCSSPAPGSSGTASPPAPTSGSGGTTSGGNLWDSFSAGSGAGGSTSGSTGGVSTDGPALSSQYTGGSGVGRITPLVYNPESDGPPVFYSGVFTGDHGSVQFVQTADTGSPNAGTDPPNRPTWDDVKDWYSGPQWQFEFEAGLGLYDSRKKEPKPADSDTTADAPSDKSAGASPTVDGISRTEQLPVALAETEKFLADTAKNIAIASVFATMGRAAPKASTTNGFGNIGSHGPVSPATALAGAEKFLGAGYKEIAPGIFRSADGLRQFRMTPRDLLPTHGNIGPHVHFEALNKAGQVIENLHLPVLP